MTISPSEHSPALAQRISISVDRLTVDLTDGRVISVPLEWYPRIAHATVVERNNWRIIGRGEGINWPALDEDVSVEDLLGGARSGESEHSLRKWLARRILASNAS